MAAATSLPFPIILSGAIAAMSALAALTFVEPPRLARQHLPTYGQIIRESASLVRRQPTIRYAILFFGLISVGSLAPIFFFQPFLREHDIGIGSLGIWQAPMRIAAIVGALAAGRIILALGERRTFLLMPVSLVASFALLATWDSVYAQVVFPVMNFTVIMSQPLVTDYVNRRVPSEQRATVLSLTNMTRSAVLIPSAPLLGLLADNASLTTAFAAGGIVIVAAGLPLLLLWLPFLGGRPEREPIAAEPISAGGGS